MKRTRSFRLVAAGVVVALTSAVAVTTSTQTASANDLTIIQGNLDDALGILLTGFSDAAETYLATESFEATADVLGNALRNTALALVAGTDQFAGLDFALGALYASLRTGLDPFLAALDDPASAADLFDFDEILANLQPAITQLLIGGPVGPSIIPAIGNLLQGANIVGPTGLEWFQPGVVFNDVVFAGIVGALYVLGNQEFDAPLYNIGEGVFLWGGIIAISAIEPFVGQYLLQAQSRLQGLLTGELAVVAGPLGALLSGLTLPALPFP